MEGPQHVLVAVEIHPGFAADCGVYLRKERGRDVGVTDAALVHTGRKAGNVRSDAAANGKDQRAAGCIGLQKALSNPHRRVHGLKILGGFQADNRLHALQRRRYGRRNVRHVFIVDDEDFLLSGKFCGYIGHPFPAYYDNVLTHNTQR